MAEVPAEEKLAEARRLAAESLEKFRDAAQKERESRGATSEEHRRVFDEAVGEETQAIETFGEAVELQRQVIQEQPPAFHAEPSPKAKPEGDGRKRR